MIDPELIIPTVSFDIYPHVITDIWADNVKYQIEKQSTRYDFMNSILDSIKTDILEGERKMLFNNDSAKYYIGRIGMYGGKQLFNFDILEREHFTDGTVVIKGQVGEPSSLPFYPEERGKKEREKFFTPKKIIFNPPAAIVIWGDGAKTLVKCGPNDIYDPEKGLALCFMKRAFDNDNNKFHKVLNKETERGRKELFNKYYGKAEELVNERASTGTGMSDEDMDIYYTCWEYAYEEDEEKMKSLEKAFGIVSIPIPDPKDVMEEVIHEIAKADEEGAVDVKSTDL